MFKWVSTQPPRPLVEWIITTSAMRPNLVPTRWFHFWLHANIITILTIVGCSTETEGRRQPSGALPMKKWGCFLRRFPRPSRADGTVAPLCSAPIPAIFYKQPHRWGLGVITPCLASTWRLEDGSYPWARVENKWGCERFRQHRCIINRI